MLLRKSDFEEVPEDADDEFYVWDPERSTAVLYGTGADPALEGSYEYEGITVTTSYTLLKEQLSQYVVADAAAETGMTEETIEHLARMFAEADAISVNISFGMDHYNNGYQSCWAIAILMALTGNVGRDGAGFTGIYLNTALVLNIPGLWAAPGFKGMTTAFPMTLLHEVARDQEYNVEPYPIKAMVAILSNSASNWPSQTNYLEELLPNLDFLLAMDMEMTDTARYSDMILPIASFYENEDFRKAHNLPYIVHQDKVIDPPFEAKDDVEIAGLIGRALAMPKRFPRSTLSTTTQTCCCRALQWRHSVSVSTAYAKTAISSWRTAPGKPGIVGREKFPTESGLAQLYTEKPAPRVMYGQDIAERFPKEHLVYYQPSAEVSERS